MLSERKKKILRAVVSENIEKPQAVSSRDLHEKYFDDVSSATIRNELMALEEMGYLFQPHTSAGRLPTEAGFKKYISDLMPERKLTPAELKTLKSNFQTKLSGVEDVAGAVARSLSQVSEYASVVYIDSLPAEIKSVKLVRISDADALVIVVTDLGVMKDLTITVDEELSDEDLVSAGRFISEVMAGKVLTELNEEELKLEFSLLADRYTELFLLVLEAIESREDQPIFKVEGASNLLSHPEYSSPEKARETLKLFENKEILVPLIETGNDLEISIKVGDSSVVSANYKINGKNVGSLGIIGPMRMDYAKAVSVLRGVNQVIRDEVQKSEDNKKLKGDKNGQRNSRDRINKES